MAEKKKGGIRLRVINYVMIAVAALVSFFLLYATSQSIREYQALQTTTDAYIRAQQDAQAMQLASDYLTQQARLFTVTGDDSHVAAYFEEAEVNRRREGAVADIASLSDDQGSLQYLEEAMAESVALMETEYRAMRLMIASKGADVSAYPAVLAEVELTPAELALSPAEQQALAQELMFGDRYQAEKDAILQNVNLCTESLITITHQGQQNSSARLLNILHSQQLLIWLLLCIALLIVALTTLLFIHPLEKCVQRVRDAQQMPETGSSEMRILCRAYNEMFEKTRQRQSQLSHEATHDPLTGLWNRKGYDAIYSDSDKTSVALLLVDVDKFKDFNDTYGHAMGDRVLQQVAHVLADSFRSEDAVCRIGGDEFAVIMKNTTSQLSGLVRRKLTAAAETLANPTPESGLPPVTLSIGVCFGDQSAPEELFQHADEALYRVKEKGRNGQGVYGE